MSLAESKMVDTSDLQTEKEPFSAKKDTDIHSLIFLTDTSEQRMPTAQRLFLPRRFAAQGRLTQLHIDTDETGTRITYQGTELMTVNEVIILHVLPRHGTVF